MRTLSEQEINRINTDSNNEFNQLMQVRDVTLNEKLLIEKILSLKDCVPRPGAEETDKIKDVIRLSRFDTFLFMLNNRKESDTVMREIKEFCSRMDEFDILVSKYFSGYKFYDVSFDLKTEFEFVVTEKIRIDVDHIMVKFHKPSETTEYLFCSIEIICFLSRHSDYLSIGRQYRLSVIDYIKKVDAVVGVEFDLMAL